MTTRDHQLRSSDIWPALALLLGGLLLYAQTLGFGFINYDTHTVLLGHPGLYDEQSLWRSLRAIFLGHFPREEPLLVRDVSWALDSRLFGHRNPLGYRLGNVLLNAINGVLLYAVLRKLTGLRAVPFITAALWAVLPVHVQPVAWIMGRKDLLVMAATMLALLASNAAAVQEERRRVASWTVVALLLTLLAMFSKFSAITLFVILALQRACAPYLRGELPGHAPLPLRAALAAAAPTLIAGALLSGAVWGFYDYNLRSFGVLSGNEPGSLSAEHLQLLARFIPVCLAVHLRHIFVPGDYSLRYQLPNANLPLDPLDVLAGYAVVAGLCVLLLWTIRRRRDLLFALLAAGLILLPYLNVVYIGIWVADRYTYLASAFLLWIAVQVGWDLGQRLPRLRGILTASVVALGMVYGVGSVLYATAWRSNLSLWTYEVSLAEPSVLSWQALAKERLRLATLSRGEARVHWQQLTEQAVNGGLARYEALPFMQTRYRRIEYQQAAKLWVVRGELAMLRGRPLAEALEAFHRGHGIAIDAKTTLSLAKAYLALAGQQQGERQRATVRESFRYFCQHVKAVARNRVRRRAAHEMLEANYARSFDYLAPEIEALRARYYR